MPLNKPVTRAKKTVSDTLWTFFTSLKLVIFLLLILSVLSIAGTIIEQNKPLNEYYRLFQPDTVALFDKLGLFDMYHSWWFTACLALLALNILACTMDRYSPIMAGLRKKSLILEEALEKSLNPVVTFKFALPFETVEKKITELVGTTFTGKPVISQEDDGSRHYFFEKGKYSRLAFFFTHLSLLIIFIGALMGSFLGYKGYVNIYEGESVSRVDTRSGARKDLGFAVKCNSFTVDFYPNGMPKEYQSDLSIMQGGKEMMRKRIQVNDPLTFAGISFYQSSYGALPDKVVLDVVAKDGALLGTVIMPFGQRSALPDTKDQVELADYQEHFHMQDGSEGGPALGINVYPETGSPTGIWLLQKDPDFDKARGSSYYLRVKNVEMKRYTGLQVNKDPGEWVVWLGSLLLIGGIMAAFFISHKKLWIRLKTDKKGRTDVTIGGTANKNRIAFVREADEIIQRCKEINP